MFKTFLTNLYDQQPWRKITETAIHSSRRSDYSPTRHSNGSQCQISTITFKERTGNPTPEIHQQYRKLTNNLLPSTVDTLTYPFRQHEDKHNFIAPKDHIFQLRIDIRNFSPYEIKIHKVSGHRIEICGRHGSELITARYMIPFEYDIDRIRANFQKGDLLVSAPRLPGPLDYTSSIVFNQNRAFRDPYIKHENIKTHTLEIVENMGPGNRHNK